MSVFSSSRFPCPEGGSHPSLVIPTGAKHRVQSPPERWPRTVSTDRPEMESRPSEFLLQENRLISLTAEIPGVFNLGFCLGEKRWEWFFDLRIVMALEGLPRWL